MENCAEKLKVILDEEISAHMIQSIQKSDYIPMITFLPLKKALVLYDIIRVIRCILNDDEKIFSTSFTE